MNENFVISQKKERKRAAKIAETCKAINTWIMIQFIILCILCATHTIDEWVMYPYTIVGGATMVVATILLAAQEMKLSDYEDE